MFKIKCVIFIALLVCTTAHYVTINQIENVEKFMANHTAITSLKTESGSQLITFYTLGSKSEGDVLLDQSSKQDKFENRRNVAYSILSGLPTHKTLSYISLKICHFGRVEQAYVTLGGLGRHYAELVFDVRDTNFIHIQVQFYGK